MHPFETHLMNRANEDLAQYLVYRTGDRPVAVAYQKGMIMPEGSMIVRAPSAKFAAGMLQK